MLKKRDIQYLQRSIIVTNSTLVNFLLSIIFFLQSPVAPVYIFNINNINYETALHKINDCTGDKNIRVILP